MMGEFQRGRKEISNYIKLNNGHMAGIGLKRYKMCNREHREPTEEIGQGQVAVQ